MKKFLVFLVAIVVVVCLGMTTYYFMRNDEVISFATKEIYVNSGETISLESLGMSRKKANRKTSFNYNAGGDKVTKHINFDESKGYYIVSSADGGDITLIITTSNKNYAEFTITVHIGNGTEEHPYYIFTENDLKKIGSSYDLGSHYKLMNDITLTDAFAPIGFDSETGIGSNFCGEFDGDGHTINALNLKSATYSNAGLFYGIGSTGEVSNLTINKANISGEYSNAGILAGTIAGSVKNVGITNSTIKNIAQAGVTGALAGVYSGSTLKTTFADNVKITIGDLNESAITNALVGGLVGEIRETTVQATYANNVNVTLDNADAKIGGLAGKLVIGSTTGSIQQSYANMTTNATDFASFVNVVEKTALFDNSKANMLRHFIGNIAIVQNKTAYSDVNDDDLVKSYDNSYFVNVLYPSNSVFFDASASQYMIRGYANIEEVVRVNEYIFFAIDPSNEGRTSWDVEYVWKTSSHALPVLRLGTIEPANPTGAYFRKDLEEKTISSAETFSNILNNGAGGKVKLISDLDLTQGWTPISLSDYTINGNGKTITLSLDNVVGDNLGLFTILDNCSIENLNIVITGVSANAKRAGALAGTVMSSDALTMSNIKNISVNYSGNFTSTEFNMFGGLVGYADSTYITDCEVDGLVMNSSVNANYAGGLAGATVGSYFDCNNVNATIYGSQFVGGITGSNDSVISNTTGNVKVNYAYSVDNACVGGIAGLNKRSITDSEMNIEMNITNANANLYVGGVVGNNAGEIANTVINGNGISISEIAGRINVGGIAGVNSSLITMAQNLMTKVGDYVVGKDFYIGGVVAINKGTISKTIASSNVYGNVVAGVVVEMKDQASATIDQVVVGKYNKGDKSLTKNEIKGDKYVAGVAVDFRLGTISNVQASSAIYGGANGTRSSLVTLVFAYGATLKNATIDTSIEGYGAKYRETWTDFSSCENKAEFGFDSATQTAEAYFNLYMSDTNHGSMQSVVINSNNVGHDSAKASFGEALGWWYKSYSYTSESSFIKVVSGEGFKSASQFQGEYTFVYGKSVWFGIEHNVTAQLTFNIGQIWEANNGLNLIFLNNI